MKLFLAAAVIAAFSMAMYTLVKGYQAQQDLDNTVIPVPARSGDGWRQPR